MIRERLNRSLADAKELEYLENSNNVLGFPSKLKKLRKNLNPNLIKKRKGLQDSKGNFYTIDYVEWHTVADILDETTPNWMYSVKEINQIGNIVTVTVAITIDGIVREGIGTGAANSEEAVKEAEHDALKRASVKFGVARELYKFRPRSIESENSKDIVDSQSFPTNPVAKSLLDMITSKQLGMIKTLARERVVDADNECDRLMLCKINELSKKAASSLITYLQGIKLPRHNEIRIPMRSVG